MEKIPQLNFFDEILFPLEDVEKSASEIASQFNMDSFSVKNKVVLIDSDIHLKAATSDTKFWSFIFEDKYPNVMQIALQLTAMFWVNLLVQVCIFCNENN